MRRMSVPLLVGLLAVSLLPAGAAQTVAITGQVVDQDGAPVAGADVYLYQWSGYDEPMPADTAGGGSCDADGACKTEPARPVGYHEDHTITDADGRFQLEAVDGWADISVSKQGYSGAYTSFEVGSEANLTLEMLKYPEKTAHVEGRVTGGGAAIPAVSISAESPEWGIYECSGGDRVLYMEETEAAVEDTETNTSEPAPDAMAAETEAGSSSSDIAIAPGEPYPYPGCAIQVEEDGSFSADLTPGYTILRFYSYDWSEGAQQYYGKSIVRVLPADATTRIDIDLAPKPGPDAIVEGYVLSEDGTALSGVYVSFSNQDSYGWAQAMTDSDGSYKVRLRSGILQVSVWADGHFPWEGDVQAASGGTTRFDITLTPGESRYGGCCIAYAEDGAVASGDKGGGAGSTGAAAPSVGEGDAQAAGSAADYQDLGGGLGPYSPAQDGETRGTDSPAFEVVAVVMAVLAVLLLRRRD